MVRQVISGALVFTLAVACGRPFYAPKDRTEPLITEVAPYDAWVSVSGVNSEKPWITVSVTKPELCPVPVLAREDDDQRVCGRTGAERAYVMIRAQGDQGTIIAAGLTGADGKFIKEVDPGTISHSDEYRILVNRTDVGDANAIRVLARSLETVQPSGSDYPASSPRIQPYQSSGEQLDNSTHIGTEAPEVGHRDRAFPFYAIAGFRLGMTVEEARRICGEVGSGWDDSAAASDNTYGCSSVLAGVIEGESYSKRIDVLFNAEKGEIEELLIGFDGIPATQDIRYRLDRRYGNPTRSFRLPSDTGVTDVMVWEMPRHDFGVMLEVMVFLGQSRGMTTAYSVLHYGTSRKIRNAIIEIENRK